MPNAYSVADKAYCDFQPLFHMIDERMKKQNRVTLAIDGNSTSGKSSLAALLKSAYSCNVFAMDDFFLRPFQKTDKRLGEPGGNVDYERFAKEVIAPLKSGNPFEYHPYDCQTLELSEAISVTTNPLNVVEGVYSLHPKLIGEYDIKIMLKLDAAEQCRRLKKRNPGMYDRFINEWIPMENRYFEAFDLPSKCDLVFDTGEIFKENCK
jgi:uridine kinase